MSAGHGQWRRPEERDQTLRPTTGRHRRTEPAGSSGLLARDHDMARLRAKLISPEKGYADLTDGVLFAYVQAGKPPLSVLGKAVGYSKATLSKVLSGKAMPSWKLVRDLGTALRVPASTVEEWSVYWTAANLARRKPATVQGRAAVPAVPGTAQDNESGTGDAQTGYTCPQCGSWVVDTARHTGWHMRIEPTGRSAPASESLGEGWNARSEELTLLREVLGTDTEG
jgi:DNA-binding XRE family transcriptional regulator